MTVGTRVQLRNDTAANWTSANPTLLAGEAGIETDTGKFKLGNGSGAWTALSYGGGGGSGTPLTTTATKTGAYTAAASERVPVDTTSGAATITLPTAPADGTAVEVGHITQGSTNAVTVARGGSSDVFNKAGGSTSVSLATVNQKMYFTYIAAIGVWWVRDALSLGSLDSRFASLASVAPLSNAPTARVVASGAGTAGTSGNALRDDAHIELDPSVSLGGGWTLKTGLYFPSPTGGTTTVTPTLGVLTCIPLWIRATTAVNQIGVQVTSANASAFVRLGIYTDDTHGYPNALVSGSDSGQLDASTTGAKTFTLSLTLAPGLYWLGAVTQGVTCTLRSHNVPTVASAVAFNDLTNYAASVPTGYAMTAVTAALPSTFSTTVSTSGTGGGPVVVVRAA